MASDPLGFLFQEVLVGSLGALIACLLLWFGRAGRVTVGHRHATVGGLVILAPWLANGTSVLSALLASGWSVMARTAALMLLACILTATFAVTTTLLRLRPEVGIATMSIAAMLDAGTLYWLNSPDHAAFQIASVASPLILYVTWAVREGSVQD